MKPYFAGIALVVLLAAGAFFILFVPPSHRSHHAVSFIQRGYQTNAMGQAIPVFAVSNSGPGAVLITPGRQIAPNVFDMLRSRPQTLAPGQAALVAVPLSAMSTQGRAFLHCQPIIPSGGPSRVRELLADYLFKESGVEYVYAEEAKK
jgi:hypothetical protein